MVALNLRTLLYLDMVHGGHTSFPYSFKKFFYWIVLIFNIMLVSGV